MYPKMKLLLRAPHEIVSPMVETLPKLTSSTEDAPCGITEDAASGIMEDPPSDNPLTGKYATNGTSNVYGDDDMGREVFAIRRKRPNSNSSDSSSERKKSRK
jgi:hypothetical protein